MEEGVCWWRGGAAADCLIQRQAASSQPLQLSTTGMCVCCLVASLNTRRYIDQENKKVIRKLLLFYDFKVPEK